MTLVAAVLQISSNSIGCVSATLIMSDVGDYPTGPTLQPLRSDLAGAFPLVAESQICSVNSQNQMCIQEPVQHDFAVAEPGSTQVRSFSLLSPPLSPEWG